MKKPLLSGFIIIIVAVGIVYFFLTNFTGFVVGTVGTVLRFVRDY